MEKWSFEFRLLKKMKFRSRKWSYVKGSLNFDCILWMNGIILCSRNKLLDIFFLLIRQKIKEKWSTLIRVSYPLGWTTKRVDETFSISLHLNRGNTFPIDCLFNRSNKLFLKKYKSKSKLFPKIFFLEVSSLSKKTCTMFFK